MSESTNRPVELHEGPKPRVFSSAQEEPGEMLPDELPFSLTRIEYHTLCAGENNESRAGYNLCLGFLGSALVGLAGLVTQVNWGEAFRQARVAPFIWAALLFGFVLSSACGALIQRQHYTRDGRPYYALMARLRRYFEESP
jgi:hypothetical protein